MNLRIICLMVTIFTPQFGLAHAYVALNLNPIEQSLTSCVSSLQDSQDYELMDKDFFDMMIRPNPDYEAIQRALDDEVNPNAFVVKAIEDRDGLIKLKSSIDLESLEKVANMHYSVFADSTVLHLAVIIGNPYIVNLLLESKARIDVRKMSGLTPFSLLAYQKIISPENVDLMVNFFIASRPIEADITEAFEHAVAKENFPMIEAIAKYARKSEVITQLRNSHLTPIRINYILSSIGFSTNQLRKKKGYYLAFKHLKERNLL